MEPEENLVQEETRQSIWTTVTPFSKYLAMGFLVLLPFLGGWIGYTYAPERVVEVEYTVEKVVTSEKDVALKDIPQKVSDEEVKDVATRTLDEEEYKTFSDNELGFKFSFPASWGAALVAWESGDSIENSASYRLLFPELTDSTPGLNMFAGSRSLTISPLGRGPSFGDLFAGETDMLVICTDNPSCESFINPQGVEIWYFQSMTYGYDSTGDFFVFDPQNEYFGPVVISDVRLRNVVSDPDTIRKTITNIIDSVEKI